MAPFPRQSTLIFLARNRATFILAVLVALASSATATALSSDRSAGTAAGADATAVVQGTGITVLANRIVTGDGDIGVRLLTLPGLGTLNANCQNGGDRAEIRWRNTSTAPIDAWSDNIGPMTAYIADPGAARIVASWSATTEIQYGTTLSLGNGNQPGARRTATVTLNAYRSGTSAPCGFQATATIWKTP